MKKSILLIAIAFALLMGAFLVYFQLEARLTLRAKHIANRYSSQLERYRAKHGGYPESLGDINTVEKIEKKNGSDFAHVAGYGMTTTIRYDRRNKEEYEFTLSDGGGILVYDSKSGKWTWYD